MRNQRSHVSTHIACDFLLERLVHQILRDDPRGGRDLLAAALDAGAAPQWLLAEVLWPAAECLAQLRQDRLISRRHFNQAARAMGLLMSQLDARLSAAEGARRRLLILAAPGETCDLGAHLLAILAEGAGFAALFAGAGLSQEEIVFALTQLEPDALVIHGSLPASLARTEELVAHLQAGRLWPQVQIACVGAMLGRQRQCPRVGDLSSAHPVEILELLALCPEHRAVPGLEAPAALQMPAGTTPAPHGQTIEELMRQMFPPRMHFN